MVSETLEKMALERLEVGAARLPRSWSSIKTYERLVERGLVREVEEPNPLLRRFTLSTDMG